MSEKFHLQVLGPKFLVPVLIGGLLIGTFPALFHSAQSGILNRSSESNQLIGRLIEQSDQLISQTRPNEALMVLQKAQAKYPSSILVNTALANFYNEAELDSRKADKYLKIAIQLAGTKASLSAPIMMAKGLQAFQKANYADAENYFTVAYQLGLRSERLIELLGAVLVANHKGKGASKLAMEIYDCRANGLLLARCFQNISMWHKKVSLHELNLARLDPVNANRHDMQSLRHQAKSINLRYKSLKKLLDVIAQTDGYFRESLIKTYQENKLLFEFEFAQYLQRSFFIGQKLKDPNELTKSELQLKPR